MKNILALVLSTRSFLSSASTMYISSSASLLFHCQFQSILASVGEKKASSSRLKSLYGFRVSVGSVMCCCSVLSTYSMWETLRTANGSNSVRLPFFPDTAAVLTKPDDNPACGGVLPERTIGIALHSPRWPPVPPFTGNLFAALMQKTREM